MNPERVFQVLAGPHVSEKPNETALVEFDKLFSQTDLVEVGSWHVVADKVIARHTNNMLFDQRVLKDQKVNMVRGKELFEFEAVDAGGVRLFDIKVVVVVVVLVHNADPHRFCVAEGAEIDAVDVKI